MRPSSEGEQPFPDSWISTTGSVALGCLTDISSEVILAHGAEGARILWPRIGKFMQQWCNGDVKSDNGVIDISSDWTPCEALVRIACSEINRFASRLAARLPQIDKDVAAVWTNFLIAFFSETLTQSLDIEHAVKKKLLKDKLRAYKLTSPQFASGQANGFSNDEPMIDEDEKLDLTTPYGKGLLVDRRVNGHNEADIVVDVINLSFGMLYRPNKNSLKKFDELTNGDINEGRNCVPYDL
jgi:hypothetical protein